MFPPNTYYQGTTLNVALTVYELGVPTNSTTATLLIRDPSGIVTTYASPTNPTTGGYLQAVTLGTTALVGVWSYYWATTGPVAGQLGNSLPLQTFNVAALPF